MSLNLNQQQKSFNAREPISVLQDWTMLLSLREQGVLVLSLRGPDGMTKEGATKAIIRSLRACVMNSGRLGKPMKEGETFDGDPFMRMDLICDVQSWAFAMDAFFADIDSHNIHFFQHLIHAAAVCRMHPNNRVAKHWADFYLRACKALHVGPETIDEIRYRLRDGRRAEAESDHVHG